MKNVDYLIAVNTDLFETVIPELPTDTDITTSSLYSENDVAASQSNNELSFVAGKFAISFGVMLLCALFIFILVKIYKKTQTTLPHNDNIEIRIKEKYTEKKASLNTASTIGKCIRDFLENTKKN